METVKVKLNDLDFEVNVSGDVTIPQKVNNVTLDDVRILAADHFLAYKKVDSKGLGLNKAQRDYWAAVRTVTPPEKRGNFRA